MVLSKDWTLDRVRGILRILANEISEENAQTLMLDDIIHLCVLDLAELLGEAKIPEYGAVDASLTQASDVIDISTLRVDRVAKLVDVDNGLVLKTDPVSFEGLADIPQKQDNIYYYQYGQSLRLYKGTGVSAYGATFTLFYDRIPTKASADGDFIDVSDKFMKLLIDKSKLMVYEDLRVTPPESLTNVINSKVQLIRQANLSEKKATEAKD